MTWERLYNGRSQPITALHFFLLTPVGGDVDVIHTEDSFPVSRVRQVSVQTLFTNLNIISESRFFFNLNWTGITCGETTGHFGALQLSAS